MYNTDLQEHLIACDNQPSEAECICLELIDAYIDEQANNGEVEFEGR